MASYPLIVLTFLNLDRQWQRLLAVALGLIWAAGGVICLVMPMSWIAAEGVVLLGVWLLFKVLGIVLAYMSVDVYFSLKVHYRCNR